jgi:anti-anti-sigma regulatory factor
MVQVLPDGGQGLRRLGLVPQIRNRTVPSEAMRMGIQIGHYPDEDRLDLTVEGNLDLTLTGGILEACEIVDQGVSTCIVDATRVARVFDSGIGLLMILCEKLSRSGVALIVIGEIPGLPAVDAIQVEAMAKAS